MGELFVNIGLSLSGYMAPEGQVGCSRPGELSTVIG
jgi:hypothetical protein